MQRRFRGVVPVLFACVSWMLSASAGAASEVEEVIVTGSYIAGTPEDAASPVDVTTREDMDITGNPNIVEMLRNMGPVTGIDGETNQFQSNGLEAISNVNLRGLGAGRTLVLMNGSRVVPNPYFDIQNGQQFVNTNAIPVIALERVELLKDGASALYGSDAVAGVVNFITRSHFRGVEFQGAYKTIDDSEDDDYELGMIVGFGTDRLDVVVAGGYQFRGETKVREKSWASSDYLVNSTPGGWTSIGNPSTYYPLAAPGLVPDPDCETVGARNVAGFCRYQYTQFDNIAEEEEHYQIWTEATYQLSDTMELHADFLYAHDEAPDWKTSPSYPPQALLDGDQIVTPGMPHYDDFLARNGLEDDPDWAAGALVWGRTFGVSGPSRVGPREIDVYRMTLGLSGEFEGGTGYDAKITYGYAEGERLTHDTRTDNLAYAFRGLGGPNCDRDAFYADPEGSGIVPGQGDCLYYNPFTSGYTASQIPGFEDVVPPGSENAALNNTEELRDWLGEYLGTKPETEQLVFDLIFNGETNVTAGGGNVAWAGGFQWRRDDYSNNPIPNSSLAETPCAFGLGGEGQSFTIPETPLQPGVVDGPTVPAWEYNCIGAGAFNFLAATEPFEDDQDVFAGFIELSVPLTDNLEMQVAARYEDYGGDVGNTIDPKVAARWQLNDTFALRGSMGSSFRAPTLNQLGGQFTSLSFVNQPLAFKAVDTTGNPDLNPEKAITANFGVIVTPNENVYLSLDWWNFDFTDPIVLEAYQDVADNCFDDDSPIQELACDQITFQTPGDPTSSIQRIEANYQNGPDIETNGFDYQATVDFPTDRMGVFTVGTQGTYVNSYEVDAWIWADKFDAEGQLNADTQSVRPLPEWKNNAYINWNMGGHNVRLDSYYVSDYKDARSVVPAGTDIDEHVTFDLHYNFRFNNDNTRIFASVYNITDEDPPFVRLDLNYDPYTHNPFGIMFKVGVTHRFAGGMFQ